MASTIPAAISGLLDLLVAQGAWLPTPEGTPPTVGDLAGVTVHDGPPVTAETPEWIAIGYQPNQDKAVDVEYNWAQIGAQKSEETYGILCCLVSNSGDTDMNAGRVRACELRDAVAAAITTDRTLGGAVRLAHISEASLLQQQTTKGRSVGFTFTVAVTARITT